MVNSWILSVNLCYTSVYRVRTYISVRRKRVEDLTVNRRNIVIFLVLMGTFVTYTQAFTVETIETNIEVSDLSKYTGPDDFLTVYTSKPLGKHKVLGTLEITNRLGVTATTYVTIVPTDSSDLPIEAGPVTTYQYKIDTGSWTSASYEDTTEIYGTWDVTISSGSTKTIYVIFEKENLATDYYSSSIIVQEKDGS